MAKKYSVKEIYYTIQGEGYHSGRPAIFCRFSGCNLWSGREEDRENAICQFCDTNFWGTDGENGGKYDLDALVDKIYSLWPRGDDLFVVFTGGEPALQLDAALVEAIHNRQGKVAIETNGTLDLPNNIDWICMSPKADTDILIRKGNEIKIIYPQEGIDPKDFELMDFDHYYIQPMDNTEWSGNTLSALNYCKNNAPWKLSVQTHKYLNIP